jgi:hypothetical protein
MFVGFCSDYEFEKSFEKNNDEIHSLVREYENIDLKKNDFIVYAPVYMFYSKENFDFFVYKLKESNINEFVMNSKMKNDLEIFRV